MSETLKSTIGTFCMVIAIGSGFASFFFLIGAVVDASAGIRRGTAFWAVALVLLCAISAAGFAVTR